MFASPSPPSDTNPDRRKKHLPPGKKNQSCLQFLWKKKNPLFYGKLCGCINAAHLYQTIGLTNPEEHKMCAQRREISVQLCQIFPGCPCDPPKALDPLRNWDRLKSSPVLQHGSGFQWHQLFILCLFPPFFGARVDPAKS